MKKIHVLFGFKTEKTADAIIRALSVLGYSVDVTVKETKQDIADYIHNTPKLNAVILKEYLDGGGELGTEELIDMCDDNKVNMVVVLDARKRGQDCMKDLYAAGILNAYFSDGKTGANADNLAKLAINGRTHKEAREYYRIDRQRNDHRFMSYYEFKDLYRYLINNNRGVNIADRFVALTRWIDREQLAFFIKTLPKQTIEELKEYKEFVEINNSLYKSRLVDYKYHVTGNAGITPENVAHKMVEEHLMRDNPVTPEIVAVSSEAPVEEVKEPVPEEKDEGNDIFAYAARRGINREDIEKKRELSKEDAGSNDGDAPLSDVQGDAGDSSREPDSSDVQDEPVKESVGKEPVKKRKGLFSGIKKKLKVSKQEQDEGVIIPELEDIGSAEENDSFSIEEAVIHAAEGMISEDAEGLKEKEDGIEGRQMLYASGSPAHTAPYGEGIADPGYDRVLRDNEDLRDRLMKLEQALSEKVEREQREERKLEDDRKRLLSDNEVLRKKIVEMEKESAQAKRDRALMEKSLKELTVSQRKKEMKPVSSEKPVREGDGATVKKPVGNMQKKAVEKTPDKAGNKPAKSVKVNPDTPKAQGILKDNNIKKKGEGISENAPVKKPLKSADSSVRVSAKGQRDIDDLIDMWASGVS